MEAMGWIGSLMLAFCGLPELCKSLKSHRCGLSWGFLILWGGGELLVLVPIVMHKMSAFLVFNYTVNLLIIGGLMWIKLKLNLQKNK